MWERILHLSSLWNKRNLDESVNAWSYSEAKAHYISQALDIYADGDRRRSQGMSEEKVEAFICRKLRPLVRRMGSYCQSKGMTPQDIERFAAVVCDESLEIHRTGGATRKAPATQLCFWFGDRADAESCVANFTLHLAFRRRGDPSLRDLSDDEVAEYAVAVSHGNYTLEPGKHPVTGRPGFVVTVPA